MSENPGYTTSSQQLSEAHQALEYFWPQIMDETKNLTVNDFKNQELPLARIKKIMKLDDDVKMISAEAPVLFARASEIFITELSLRAWIHTEDNKRRTLQRNDIAMAITKYDQFDFLIDIVPRDELKPPTKRPEEAVRTTTMAPDQVQYYLQLAQQHQAALQQQPQIGTAQAQIAQAQQPQIQIVQGSAASLAPAVSQTVTVQNTTPTFSMPSMLQVQSMGGTAEAHQQVQPAVQQQQQQQPTQQIQLQVQQAPQATAQSQMVQLQPQVQQQVPQGGGIQIVQQVINSNGEIQQIPIQLTQAQLQLIRMQMQGQSTGQPIIIQAAPLQQPAPPPQPVQQPQTLYQIQTPGQPTSVFLAPANTVAAAQGAAVQIQTQQDGQVLEEDSSEQ